MTEYLEIKLKLWSENLRRIEKIDIIIEDMMKFSWVCRNSTKWASGHNYGISLGLPSFVSPACICCFDTYEETSHRPLYKQVIIYTVEMSDFCVGHQED